MRKLIDSGICELVSLTKDDKKNIYIREVKNHSFLIEVNFFKDVVEKIEKNKIAKHFVESFLKGILK